MQPRLPLLGLLDAEAGDTQAVFVIGDLFSHGKGVYADSARCLKAATEADHPLACYNLGDYYLYGTGVAREPAQAAWWCLQAAGQGSNRGGVRHHQGCPGSIMASVRAVTCCGANHPTITRRTGVRQQGRIGGTALPK